MNWVEIVLQRKLSLFGKKNGSKDTNKNCVNFAPENIIILCTAQFMIHFFEHISLSLCVMNIWIYYLKCDWKLLDTAQKCIVEHSIEIKWGKSLTQTQKKKPKDSHDT